MTTLDKMWGEFTSRFSRLPVWLPGISEIELGDIGTVDERGWQRLSNLRDHGVDFETTPLTDVQPSYEVDSSAARTVSASGTASVDELLTPAVNAGLNLDATFASEGAFVVRAYNVVGSAIKDVGLVDDRIQQRDAVNAFWKRRWIYVTELAFAEPFVFLVSSKSDSSARVKAELGAPGVGDGGLSLGVEAPQGLAQKVVSPRRTAFLWRGRWRGRWWSDRWRDLGDSDELDLSGLEEGSNSDSDELFEDFSARKLFGISPGELDKLDRG